MQILRLPDVMARTGLGRTTLYRLAKAGQFPNAIKITGQRAAGWLADDVNRWIEQRVAAHRERAA